MDINDMAVELAKARVAMEEGDVRDFISAFTALDNGGVFATLDGHTGYASAQDVLAAHGEAKRPRKDPAEWGDATGYADSTEEIRWIEGTPRSFHRRYTTVVPPEVYAEMTADTPNEMNENLRRASRFRNQIIQGAPAPHYTADSSGAAQFTSYTDSSGGCSPSDSGSSSSGCDVG